MCDSPTEEDARAEQLAYLRQLMALEQRSRAKREARSPSVSSSSSEEDKPASKTKSKAKTNGVKHVLVNGKGRKQAENGAADDDIPEDKPEDEELYKPGMKNGLKHLYSGKEDK